MASPSPLEDSPAVGRALKFLEFLEQLEFVFFGKTLALIFDRYLKATIHLIAAISMDEFLFENFIALVIRLSMMRLR